MKINHKVVMTGSESQTSMKMLFDVAPPAPPNAPKSGAPGTPVGSAPAYGSVELV